MVGFGLNAYFSIAIQSLVEKFYPCSELSIATAIIFVAEGFGFSGNYIVNIECEELMYLSFSRIWNVGTNRSEHSIYNLFDDLL